MRYVISCSLGLFSIVLSAVLLCICVVHSGKDNMSTQEGSNRDVPRTKLRYDHTEI